MALTVIEGLLNGLNYHDADVLNSSVPHIHTYPERNRILIEENTPVHITRVTQKVLHEPGVLIMA